jgi:hypothetical protein
VREVREVSNISSLSAHVSILEMIVAQYEPCSSVLCVMTTFLFFVLPEMMLFGEVEPATPMLRNMFYGDF